MAKELLASQEGIRSVECYSFCRRCGDLCSLKANVDEFKSGGLREKHGAATYTLGTISTFAGILRKTV